MASRVDDDDFAYDDDMGEEFDDLDPTLRNIIDQKSLNWVFVGGKGGVGKTTTSCSLALQLALARDSVLVVSTDPAHNLSDAFGQKFGKEPTKVEAWELGNVYCMEIDTNTDGDELSAVLGKAAESGGDSGGAGLGIMQMIANITSQIPGIDELLSFAQLMRHVQRMDYSVIVFDTAPTGHTLRLLSIPSTMDKAFGMISQLKDKFGGLAGQLSGLMGMGSGASEGLMAKLEETKQVIKQVYTMSQDPEQTTFVCVCIPEFLSLYETERLVQQLSELDIDTHNIVVNQILHIDEVTDCKRCLSRKGMQDEYLDQITELYGADFHVVKTPLLDQEVRGVPYLLKYGSNLMKPHDFATADKASPSKDKDTTAKAASSGGAGGGAGASAATAAATSSTSSASSVGGGSK